MKGPKKFVENQSKEVFSILGRIKNRDLEGNSGIAIKNSTYNLLTTLTNKIGSLLFTIILARWLLGPEKFGLYSLALTTIVIFGTFADLGIGQTLVKFVSSSLGKGDERKAKSYFLYLVKTKLVLFLIVSFVLLISASFISNNFYQKPIFYALLAGPIYLLLNGLINIFTSLFQASNNFKRGFQKELILQSLKLIIVPLVIVYGLNKFSLEILIFFIFLALSFCFLITFIYIYTYSKKQISFLKFFPKRINRKEKMRLNGFVLSLSAISVSAVLFGYIDTIMLGGFVSASFIGYYRVAFDLISSTSLVLAFSTALFPIFSRLKGKRLNRGLRKSVGVTSSLTIPIFLLVFCFSPLIIRILFGTAYNDSSNILRILSVLIVLVPLISLYSHLIVSQNKPKILAKVMLISGLLNIVLNYILITSLLKYGFLAAVYGAAIATVISKVVYLFLLVLNK
jgi:O-antigen/teichoic acid export membrane protein